MENVMDQVFISGYLVKQIINLTRNSLMVIDLKVNTWMMLEMEKEHTSILMEANSKDSTEMMKDMVMAFLCGRFNKSRI